MKIALDVLESRYGCMKVVYDSIQTTVSAIKTSFDSTSKGLNKRVDEINQIVDELRQRLLGEQKAFKEAMQQGLMGQFSKMQKHIAENIQELSRGWRTISRKKKNLPNRPFDFCG